MNDLANDAADAAAKATGLRPDQVKRAVEEYRKASEALYNEPEWTALMHMSYRDGSGIQQYRDATNETAILLQVECYAKGDQRNVYVLDGKPFETYGEARSAELSANARPKPYSVE